MQVNVDAKPKKFHWPRIYLYLKLEAFEPSEWWISRIALPQEFLKASNAASFIISSG